LGKMLDSRPFLKEPSNIHDGSRYQGTLDLCCEPINRKRRLVRQPIGIELAQQVSQRQLRVLPRTSEVLFDEFTESQTFSNSPTTIRPPIGGSESRSLEVQSH